MPPDLSRKVAQARATIADIMRKNDYGMGKTDTISGSGLTFGEEFKKLNAELDQTPSKVDEINTKIRTLRANMKTLGVEGKSIFTEMKEKAIKFVKWFGMTTLIMKVRTYVRQLFTTVYELDTALTDLRKTFRDSTSDLEDFYYESNKIAKQMGATTKEIISQASAWSRL